MVSRDVAREFPDFLRDESRLLGNADAIAFPETKEEVVDLLLEARDGARSITVQGARTGIVGGAVPQGGLVVNLSHMRRFLGLDRRGDHWSVAVEPGVLIAELNAALHSRLLPTEGWTAACRDELRVFSLAPEQFLPPDPTEKTASVGGAVACNSSGARSFAYGPMRRFVRSLTVALADGQVIALHRGRDRARGRSFELAGREGSLPSYVLPAVKNAAGYYAVDDMDLVDLFVGSEGTLGIVVEVELDLEPMPPFAWGVTAFLPTEAQALRFVRSVRERPPPDRAAALELFGPSALAILAAHQQNFAGLPGGADSTHCAVYVEYHGQSEDELETRLEAMGGMLEASGGNESRTWIATEPAELLRLQDFRHAVPEAVNRLIDERKRTHPAITKLSTDMAVPDASLEDSFGMYHRGLDRLGGQHVIFGHVGDNHVHVNLLPRDAREYEAGKELCAEWAREVIAMGGSISAEHGVGKLKRDLLRSMYGERGIEEMRAVKHVLDPQGLLGRGNLF